jgi:hypothetical protein
VHFWAPKLFDGMSAEEATAEACRAARRPEGLAEIQELLGLAIQEWANSAGTFTGLVRLITGQGV